MSGSSELDGQAAVSALAVSHQSGVNLPTLVKIASLTFFRGSFLDKHIYGIKDLTVRNAASGFFNFQQKNANVKRPKLRHWAGTTGERNKQTTSGDGTMSTMFMYVRVRDN